MLSSGSNVTGALGYSTDQLDSVTVLSQSSTCTIDTPYEPFGALDNNTWNGITRHVTNLANSQEVYRQCSFV